MVSTQRQIPSWGFSGNFIWIIAVSAVTVTLWSGSIASVYGAPAKLDPIAVAVPNDGAAPEGKPVFSASVAPSTTVDIENAQIVEVQQGEQSSQSANDVQLISNEIPAYLLELNDPDIGGPVEYIPADDGGALKVIAWDLVPPADTEPAIITAENNTPKRVVGVEDPKTHNIKVSLTNAVSNLEGVASEGVVSVVDLNRPDSTNGVTSQFATEPPTAHVISPSSQDNTRDRIKFPLHSQNTGAQLSTANTESSTEQLATTSKSSNGNHYRGTTYYTSTTPRTTRPTRTTTTTTHRPTTTTTRRTTPTTTAPTTPAPTKLLTTTTTESLDSSQFYQLENGDSYTLPEWLADIDDPDLDAAVTFVVPDDINEYNITLDTDILPPLEPFVDLNSINLPTPTESTTKPTPTTTTSTTTRRPTTTTTTRRSTTPTHSTKRPHWVRADPITPTMKPASLNNRFASNHNSQTASTFTHSDLSTQASFQSTFTITSTTTTTPRPFGKMHAQQPQNFNAFNQALPVATVDSISGNGGEANQGEQPKPANPFLPTRNNGAYNAQKLGRPTVTSTTTTTTPAPVVEENPFSTDVLPDWLADFDYPELRPGVPFNYDPAAPEENVANDLLPPSNIEVSATEAAKPVFVTSSPTSFSSFNSKSPPNFAHQSNSFTSTSSFAPTSTLPSKVTIPIPSIQANQNQNTVTLPPVVFIPPTIVAESTDLDNDADANANVNRNADAQAASSAKKPTSTNFNKHFAAPFDSSPVAGAAGAPSAAGDNQAYNGASKTTFTKSDDGKVLTNNGFFQGAENGASGSAPKPFGFDSNFGNQQKGLESPNQFVSSTTTGASTSASTNTIQSATSFAGSTFTKTSTTNGFSGVSTGAQQPSGFGNSNQFGGTATTAAGGGKYTGGFGGAPGFLSGTNVGARRESAAAATTQTGVGSNFGSFGSNRFGVVATAASSNSFQHKNRFGGPPGILTPYDNVKGGRP